MFLVSEGKGLARAREGRGKGREVRGKGAERRREGERTGFVCGYDAPRGAIVMGRWWMFFRLAWLNNWRLLQPCT